MRGRHLTAQYRGRELAERRTAQGGWELEVVECEPGSRGFNAQHRRWVMERTQPQYLQLALDVQPRLSHDWAHRAAEPAHGGETAPGSSAGVSW
jgi:hypothetical protein